MSGGRGSCRRTRSLRCTKCYEQNIRGYLLGYGARLWENVSVIAEAGPNGYLCKCGNCDHQYISNSAAARRHYKYLKTRGLI